MTTEMNMSKQMGMSKEMGMNGRGGHLYMQTNEVKNAIIHYHRSVNGTLTEVERVATGGAGSGTFKPISGQESAPNSFEGAGSVILSPDRKFLFATNGGDNSVSSFAVADQGGLKLIDTKPTGNAVEGKSGTAKSLAYSPSKGMLYVVHSFGPDHIRLMSVSSDGKLTPRMERYTANTPEKPHRVPTMGVLSPDENFFLVGTTFDLPIAISGTYRTVHPFFGCLVQTANIRSSLRMRQIPTASLYSAWMQTARSATPRSRTEGAVLLSTSPSCTIGRIRSSLDTPLLTESAWAALMKTAELASTRSCRSTQGEARPLNFAGCPSPPMTDSCTLRFSGIATSPPSISTASRSGSRRILRAPTSRAMAPSGDFVEMSAAVPATTGFRRTAPFSTRSTGTPRNWWGTPPSQTAR